MFIGVVVLLGTLLLMLAFRSIVIRSLLSMMNLLSAGAAFGVVVAVFQYGCGTNLPGLGSSGPVEAVQPVMMPGHPVRPVDGLTGPPAGCTRVRTGDHHKAARAGQAATGQVISAAAAIMNFVFLASVSGGQRIIAEFGLGLGPGLGHPPRHPDPAHGPRPRRHASVRRRQVGGWPGG